MSPVLRIGLTGGIGAGKSTVAARSVELGAVLLDADRIAREVVGPGTPGLAAVVQAFGPGILDPGGGLDRAALGRAVFGDDAQRSALNAILHPLIGRRTAQLAAAAPADAVLVHDVPLLVENGLGSDYHLVVVVDAPEPVRVARLEQRGMDRDDARRRIRSQAGPAARQEAADVWLDNGADRGDTLAQVDRLWRDRLMPYRANLLAGRAAARPGPVTQVPARPEWAAQAARLIARIRRVVGDAALRIDHIGSTAVPGLRARDVIDVHVVVSDLDTAAAVAAELPAGTGLIRQPGRWWDGTPAGDVEKVMLKSADPGRAVNCHVRVRSSPAWEEAVLLRDRLRADRVLAADYAGLKERLAAEHPDDVEAYAEAKAPWIRAALARAHSRRG